ncbi:MAG: hypothetical protein VX278_16450, partial [Myxococcota bacterium]|nr:hypothetical protein [Myxococcota bacterium]
MRLLSVFFVMCGCSEYDIKSTYVPELGEEEEVEVESEEEPEIELPVCETLSFPAIEVSINESCEIAPQYGSFTPVVKWTKPNWNEYSGYNNIMMAPIVVPLNDDNGDGLVNEEDFSDVVVLTYTGGGGSNSILRAVSGIDGSELWSVNNSHQITGAVAGGDIDNDGLIEVIVPGSGTLYAYENDGTLKWTATGLSGHMYNTS